MTDPIRIANCSGFFGDRPSGALEMVEGGPIEVLTGDWLAELTMLILVRQKMKHGNGYARLMPGRAYQGPARAYQGSAVDVSLSRAGISPVGPAGPSPACCRPPG